MPEIEKIFWLIMLVNLLGIALTLGALWTYSKSLHLLGIAIINCMKRLSAYVRALILSEISVIPEIDPDLPSLTLLVHSRIELSAENRQQGVYLRLGLRF